MLRVMAAAGFALLLAPPGALASHHDCGTWQDQIFLQEGWSNDGCFRAGHGGFDEGFCSEYDAVGVGIVTYETALPLCADRVIVNPNAPLAPEVEGGLTSLALQIARLGLDESARVVDLITTVTVPAADPLHGVAG